MLRGWAQLMESGFPAGTGLIRQAVAALLARPELQESDLPMLESCEGPIMSMWDFDSWQKLVGQNVQLARSTGALTTLVRTLVTWSDVNIAGGDFSAAEMA